VEWRVLLSHLPHYGHGWWAIDMDRLQHATIVLYSLPLTLQAVHWHNMRVTSSCTRRTPQLSGVEGW
jgi:hypothetical protein